MKRNFRNKIASLALSLVLVITAIPFFGASAFATTKSTPTISISNAEAEPGDTVDLTVSLDGNPGITSLDFRINYDNTQLELTKKANGSILGGTMFSQTLEKIPYYCGWINATAKSNTTTDGILITLTFKVKSDATNGKHAVSFTDKNGNSVSEVTAYNAKMEPKDGIAFSPEDGYIEVKNGKEPVKEDPKDTSTDTSKDTSKDTGTDTSKDTSKDTGTDTSKDTTGGTTGGSTGGSQTGNTDAVDKTDKTDDDTSTAAGDEQQTLTKSQKKIVAKVQAMKVTYKSVTYNKSKKKVTLKYAKSNKSYRVDGYQIWKSTKKSSGYKKIGTTTKTTFTNSKNLKSGKTYYYKVRGFRKVAGKTYYTNWSAKTKVKIK